MRKIPVFQVLLVAGCGLDVSATGTSDGNEVHIEVRTSGTKVYVGPNVATPKAKKAVFDLESWKVGDVVFDVAAEDGRGGRATTQVTVKHDPKRSVEFADCQPGDAALGFRVATPGGSFACAPTPDGTVGFDLWAPTDAKLTVDGVLAVLDENGRTTVRVPLWPHLATVPIGADGTLAIGSQGLPVAFKVHVERPGKSPADEEFTADLGKFAALLWERTWDDAANGKPAPHPSSGRGIAWHRTWRVTGPDNVTRSEHMWQVFGAQSAGEVSRVVQTTEVRRPGASCGKYQLGSGKEVEPRLQLVDWTLTVVPGAEPPKTFKATGGCPAEMVLDKENPDVVERYPAPEPIAKWLSTL